MGQESWSQGDLRAQAWVIPLVDKKQFNRRVRTNRSINSPLEPQKARNSVHRNPVLLSAPNTLLWTNQSHALAACLRFDIPLISLVRHIGEGATKTVNLDGQWLDMVLLFSLSQAVSHFGAQLGMMEVCSRLMRVCFPPRATHLVCRGATHAFGFDMRRGYFVCFVPTSGGEFS